MRPSRPNPDKRPPESNEKEAWIFRFVKQLSENPERKQLVVAVIIAVVPTLFLLYHIIPHLKDWNWIKWSPLVVFVVLGMAAIAVLGVYFDEDQGWGD